MREKCIILMLLAWCCVVASARAEMTTVIYPILFGDPTALEEFASAVVAEDGHVVLDGKGARLIVITTAEKHAILDEVMGKADAQTGNVRIEVRFRETGEVRERAAGIRGEGDVVLGPGGWEGSIAFRPDLRHTTTETRHDTTQAILAASGREAILRVGERVPYLDWIVEYGWYRGYITTRLQWQEVGSFLVVTPTILHNGQTVHIRITPELRGLVNGQPHHTRFSGLATDVLIRNGETVSIGGSVEDREFYSRYLIGVDQSGMRRSLDIDLTPRIIKPTP